MNVTEFSYCINCGVREIPSVQDVLYALHLSGQQEYYTFSLGNHAPYIANVHLVCAALDVGAFKCHSETTIRELIALAILKLCPEEAKCMNYPAYTELLRFADMPVLKHDAGTCAHCLALEKQDRRQDLPGWDAEDDEFFDIPRGR
ncbi:MAG: hypothetical protein PHC53_04775 [Patescibacteria group bacterium]|nr:hypothetical protein [Patescibacteria group bacterium]